LLRRNILVASTLFILIALLFYLLAPFVEWRGAAPPVQRFGFGWVAENMPICGISVSETTCVVCIKRDQFPGLVGISTTRNGWECRTIHLSDEELNQLSEKIHACGLWTREQMPFNNVPDGDALAYLAESKTSRHVNIVEYQSPKASRWQLALYDEVSYWLVRRSFAADAIVTESTRHEAMELADMAFRE
jgi:hypothetical protein